MKTIMKKTYRKPEMAVIDMAVENLIAASLTIDAGKIGDQQLSNKGGGWNSDDWSDLDGDIDK